MSASRVKKSAKPSPAKLARGRHPLTQQAVAESQRHRMLLAVAGVVAQKGYGAATVADVIAQAGVSRRTFYELFANIEDCYLAAYEHGMQHLFVAIRDAVARLPKDDWQARTRAALAAYFEALAGMPEAAWAYSVEVLGAGRRAQQARAWVIGQWVAQWRALHRLRKAAEPETPDLPDVHLLALVGGIEEMVRDALARDGAPGLPALIEPASRFALAVLSAR